MRLRRIVDGGFFSLTIGFLLRQWFGMCLHGGKRAVTRRQHVFFHLRRDESRTVTFRKRRDPIPTPSLPTAQLLATDHPSFVFYVVRRPSISSSQRRHLAVRRRSSLNPTRVHVGCPPGSRDRECWNRNRRPSLVSRRVQKADKRTWRTWTTTSSWSEEGGAWTERNGSGRRSDETVRPNGWEKKERKDPRKHHRRGTTDEIEGGKTRGRQVVERG